MGNKGNYKRRMKKMLLLVVLGTWMSGSVSGNLSFIKDSQSRRFGSSSVSYSLAPFGKFPYGRELFGKLSYDFKSGCSPFALTSANHSSDIPHMLLLDSSDCNVKLQALNAENARAKLLIISKGESESENDMFERVLHANHIKVSIPTLVVSHDIGEKLKELIDETGELYLKFTLPLPKHDHVKLDVFAVKRDKTIWKFLVGFKNYALQFRDKLSININVFAGSDKDVDATLQLALGCLDNVQLFEVLPSFISKCVNSDNASKACLDSQVSAFDKTFVRQYSTCFKIRESQLESVKSAQSPESSEKSSFVKINGFVYHGSIRPMNVFEAVCGGFMESPGNCLYLNNKYVLNKDFHSIVNQRRKHKTLVILASLFVTILLLFVVGFLLCLIYNKIYQKTLNEKVGEMVRDSVVQYQSMRDNV
jgi:hypothetical protein